MADSLINRVALITGAGRGIGRAMALALAKEGSAVAINDYDTDVAEATAQEIKDTGGQAIAVAGDIASFDTAAGIVQSTIDYYGSLDILINCAGNFIHSMIWEMTEEVWDRVVTTHLKGTFNCMRHACVPMMKQGWGRIINTTSVARLGVAGDCNYVAAKGGIASLTKAAALELGRYGITCNAYDPIAATRMTIGEEEIARVTELYESGNITKDFYERVLHPPLPETVPPLIVYLCTDAAADINGQIFRIRGENIAIYGGETEKNNISKEAGLWTVAELAEAMPKVVLKGYENPAPGQ